MKSSGKPDGAVEASGSMWRQFSRSETCSLFATDRLLLGAVTCVVAYILLTGVRV